MKDKVLSQRRYLLFLPPPASFSTSGGGLVATIQGLKGTSMDSRGQERCKTPFHPTGAAHRRHSPDPRASSAESEVPGLAGDGEMVGQTQTGWN